MMVSKAAFVLLGVMVIAYSSYSNAKNIENLNIMDANAVITRNEKLCEICQDYTTKVISFFEKDGTAINQTLYHVCSYLHSLEEQCLSLVDHFISILFAEIAKLQPENICKNVYLCENKALAHELKYDDPCTVCHNVVSEVLSKLDDPDAQLEIIQKLLKGCSQIGNFSLQCKRLVLEYGPVIIFNAEKFFEKTDVCTAIHACKAQQIAAIEQQFLPVAAAAV
ncbi:proactivator polypeptide-like 1 [Dendrobium catenatum]|uniref:Pulmonary surfactant-associated protein B n=1 Tax=Dendrobium catenatum TaxID=906689 RepID=A0A2I0WZU5_9ASPA|nr:proactivator polypeptide-like 1 [Dendrobium catenatum]PKU81192.1 hypothetical protein MA16_Dca015668 [Dendrobium catenatum]